MSITFGQGIILGAGITVAPSIQGITVQSSDINNPGYGGIVVNGTVGFTSDGTRTCAFTLLYQPNLQSTTLGNSLASFWTANSLAADQTGYVFNASWGPGSAPGSDKVFLAFYNGGGSSSLIISPISTANNDWQTPGTNVGSIQAAAGTFNWPLQATLYQPIIHDNANWC